MLTPWRFKSWASASASKNITCCCWVVVIVCLIVMGCRRAKNVIGRHHIHHVGWASLLNCCGFGLGLVSRTDYNHGRIGDDVTAKLMIFATGR
jgi:hypothetical protein